MACRIYERKNPWMDDELTRVRGARSVPQLAEWWWPVRLSDGCNRSKRGSMSARYSLVGLR
jgi:hypothetical protein